MIVKHLSTSLLALACCVSFAFAQDGGGQGKPGTKRPVLEKMRERADKNDDGKLGPVEQHQMRARMSRDEHMKESWQRFQAEHPQAAAKLKEKADTDGDGKVSAEEREAAREQFRAYEKQRWQEFQEKHPEAAERLKDRADKNDDGKLGPVEKRAALEKAGDLREKRIENFDKDGNGRLDADERAVERQWLEEHRPRPEGETMRKERREALKDRADRNDDGRVGPRERQELRERKPEPRTPPGPRPQKK